QGIYLQWAIANTPDILEPLFYTTMPNQGDQWTKPRTAVANAAEQFNPQQYLIGAIPDWVTPDQRTQINKARQAEAKRKADEQKAKHPAPTRAPTRSPGPGTGAGEEGGGRNYAPPGSAGRNYAPAAPFFAAGAAPAASPPPVAQRPPFRPPVRGSFEGDDMGGPGPGFAGPGAVQPANLPQPGTDYPQGEFDTHDPKWTAKVPPTIEVWAHDETAQAGKTYHYRIVYKVR